jgi:molybdopterin/thiamine biosynthesis adenylyltransferase
MDKIKMKNKWGAAVPLPWSLRLPRPLFEALWAHLFPGDNDEHGAVIAAGISRTSSGVRLLARELFLAQDGVDYVPGTHGYRALTARFVAEKANYCAQQNLCYLAIHCHGGEGWVEFSRPDLESQERGYPALLDITDGGPVGALVFAEGAGAGNIWTPEGQRRLSHMDVVGSRIERLHPKRPRATSLPDASTEMYDRQSRLFGEAGQDILRGLKVGLIGAGGAGSLLNELLARLGVGHLVVIDYDVVEKSNLPRLVGATNDDVRHKRLKVHVAERVSRAANPSIKFDAIEGDVTDENVATLLRDADFLFLAADSMQSRLVFNALVYGYLIPGMQVGAKVEVERDTGEITQVFAVTRPVLPMAGGGCLLCQGLIPASRLQEEALSNEERRAQRYVEDDIVVAPSVITLNALATAQAANDFLMMFTGLFEAGVSLNQVMYRVQERRINTIKPLTEETCLHCGSHPKSLLGYGDQKRLPCRMAIAT